MSEFVKVKCKIIILDKKKSFLELGDEFCKIGVREPQETASKAFCQFGEYHRAMEKYGIQMLKKTKPILKDLGTYLSKVKKNKLGLS